MRSILRKKMLRDMKRSAAAYIICTLIVALGFCGYSVLELCYENLAAAKDVFLEQSDFCDGFAVVEPAPRSFARTISAVQGIDFAEGRLEKEVRVSGFDEDVELKLVSWEADAMNQPVLSRGQYPEGGRRELVLGDGMAKARNINPGDAIELIIGGKRVDFTVSGIGLSPENIYMIKGMSDMFPDLACYDAGFMPYDTMAALYGMSGQANSFLFRLESGTVWADVQAEIKQAAAPYGVRSAFGKEDQLSISMVDAEVEQLGRMSGVIPFLFLTVAGVIIYITLSRLVEQQRTQVGIMLAMGIPLRKLRRHYMSYGAFTGLLGGILGGVSGYLFSGPMSDFYRVYFNLPKVSTPVSYTYFAAGIAVAVLFCTGTAWMAAGSLGKLTPASALRPAAPRTAKISFLERMPGFTHMLTVPGLMAVRNMTRNRRRTLFSLCGMAFAYMLTTTLVSMNTMFDVFLFDYWEKTQKQDIMVQFDRPVAAADALSAVRHEQVTGAEGVMEFPVSLFGPAGMLDCTVQAIDPASSLVKLYQEDGTAVSVQEDGIVLSLHMAAMLGVQRGDMVELKVIYPKEQITRIPVTAVIAQYLGSTAYMSYEGAGNVSAYRKVYSAMLLKAPLPVQTELVSRLEDAASVSVIENRQSRVEKYRAMMGSMSAIMASMSMLGVIIGVAVIYVSSLISFEELTKEVSTLMMLGLKSRQCLDVIATGQWILAAGGVILGIPLAMYVSYLMSATMSSELYSIPSFINGQALLQSIGLMALSVAFSSSLMFRKLRKMSPAQLLRCRE